MSSAAAALAPALPLAPANNFPASLLSSPAVLTSFSASPPKAFPAASTIPFIPFAISLTLLASAFAPLLLAAPTSPIFSSPPSPTLAAAASAAVIISSNHLLTSSTALSTALFTLALLLASATANFPPLATPLKTIAAAILSFLFFISS